MFELAALVVLEIAVLAAVLVLREPKLLILCVVIGLPFEYLETRLVDNLGSEGIRGAVRSLLNPGQAAMAATIVVGAVRLRHNPGRLIPNSSLILPVVALFALLFLGVAWSDNQLRPANSVLILPLYLGFILVAPTLIENRRDVELIAGTVFAVAIGLSLLAIAQRLFGVFHWREILIQSDAYSYRSNATFADPNNLARYLAISMSLAAGTILVMGPRRLTVYLALPLLAVGSVGIITTASRAGWMMLILCTFLVVMTAPIERYTKGKIVFACTALLGTLLGLLLWEGGTDAERVRSLSMGVQAIGQREFLIKAGWEMFKDNPLIGVGSGNYQHSLIVSYLWVIPLWARTTLSHTSLISIMAELGIVGLSMFILVSVRIAVTLGIVYFRTIDRFNRLLVGWLGAAFIGIVLDSQSEGRLLDEPYLWFLLALFIAFETQPLLAGLVPERVSRRVTARVREPAPVRTPPLAPEPAPVPGAG